MPDSLTIFGLIVIVIAVLLIPISAFINEYQEKKRSAKHPD